MKVLRAKLLLVYAQTLAFNSHAATNISGINDILEYMVVDGDM